MNVLKTLRRRWAETVLVVSLIGLAAAITIGFIQLRDAQGRCDALNAEFQQLTE